EALADARDHGLAGVPGLAAVLPLPLRRRHDALALADQVDAGALAEAVAPHPLREPLDAHVQRQLVIVGIDRGGDGLAQVGPAVAAGVRVAVAAALARDVEFAGGHDAVLRRAQPAVEPGQRHERLHRRARR